jgi:hypothetical protein
VDAFTALLRHFDWKLRARTADVYEVWGPDDDSDEVLVPLDSTRGDFEALLGRARRAIVNQYGRTASELIATLEMRTKAVLDATLWKKETALEAGVIGWEQGESLFAAARSQLVASAKSSREPRRYHGNASSHIARRFIDNSLMGQTAIGSFVITAYTPASQRFFTSKSAEDRSHTAPRGLWDSETLSGAEILNTLESALRAVREGLDEYKRRPQVDLFLETVQEGVSYEFAKALSEIVAGGDSAVEIQRQGRVGGSSSVPVEIAFEAVEAPILTNVANAFAEDPEPQNVTLVGEVTLLSRSSDVQPDRLIRLNIEEGADVRKARVRLTAEQYSVAMEAHREEASLRVSGSLDREGNVYWLYNPSAVSIVERSGGGADGSRRVSPKSSHAQPELFEGDDG